jgi:hypothetical protein
MPFAVTQSRLKNRRSVDFTDIILRFDATRAAFGRPASRRLSRMSSAPERTEPFFSEPKGGEERRSFRGRMTRLSRRLAGHRPPSPFPFRCSRWSRLRAPIRLKFAPYAIIPASDVCSFANLKVASTNCKLPTPAWRPFHAAPPHPTRLRRVWRFAPFQRGPEAHWQA